MELQPFLIGQIVTVRPLVASDFELLFEVARDPLIWELHPFPRFEKEMFVEFFEAALAARSGLIFLDSNTLEVIGSSRFYNLEKHHVYIGYTFLARSHWGGKFNKEIKALMLDHAFKHVSKVFFDVGETNLRSRRAIEKIGARFVKNQILREKPYTLYEIDKENFTKNFEANNL